MFVFLFVSVCVCVFVSVQKQTPLMPSYIGKGTLQDKGFGTLSVPQDDNDMFMNIYGVGLGTF